MRLSIVGWVLLLVVGCDESPTGRSDAGAGDGPRDAAVPREGGLDTAPQPDGPAADLPPFKPGWHLIWSDEFNGAGVPDPTRWDYEVGCSIRNGEAQYYTKARTENARQAAGELIIEARDETMGSCSYTSASLISKGRAHLRYGRVEVRAKLPTGKGMWPAIWMMPAESVYGSWPKSGEIDIMENVGFDPDTIYMTVHTEAYNHTTGNAKGGSTTVTAPYSNYYTYALEWQPDRLDFFVDQTKHFSFSKPAGADHTEWPFDQPFYLLLNIAVGGGWGGQQGIDPSIFPQRMQIESVKLYKWLDDPGPHTLTVDAGSGGSVTVSPVQQSYRAGTVVTLTAVPDSSYRFAGWSGTDVGMLENPLSLTVTADQTIAARFVRQDEMLKNGDFAAGTQGWYFHTQAGAQATFAVQSGEARVSISDGGTEAWHAQLVQGGLALAQGKTYRLSLDARAAAARSITVGLGMSQDPWTGYGSKVLALSTSTQTLTHDFSVGTTDADARLTLDLGKESADVFLDNLSLVPVN